MASDLSRSLSLLTAALFRAAFLFLLPAMVLLPRRADAAHVKGRYIQYKYNGVGASSGTSNYTITVTVFFSCVTQGPRVSLYLGIFNASTRALVTSKSINATTALTVSKTSFSPCMSDPPSICYEIYTYIFAVRDSGTSPLGSGVTIDPVTGLISGTAPSTTGEYVVAVPGKAGREHERNRFGL